LENKIREGEYDSSWRGSVLMDKNILLLGDSIIDNRSYVLEGELDVTAHLKKLYLDQPDVSIANNAVDGDTMYDLEQNHLGGEELQNASHIIVSIGGNDLLHNISFLQTTSELSKVMGKDARIGKWGVKELNPSRNKVFEETYFEIIKPFTKQYETIVANLSNHRAKLLLCTVYEGDLVDSDEFSDVNNSSKTMVSLFNDIVYRTANKYGADVLELREIFVSPEDYANPIEPSHIGGGKLAKAIRKWVNNV
jgi:lysophospholipase L1-like esterase